MRGNDARNGNEDSEEVTKWGYLAQTVNQNWIILRSINRGRWYRFRVAAVSKFGSHGYSTPTNMFILSQQPKPPAQPENLTVTELTAAPNAHIDAHVTWLPSKRSDLPVIYYKLTWKLADKDTQIENTISENEYEESEMPMNRDDSNSELIDAQQPNKYTLKGLIRNSAYLLELTAMSKYEDKFLMSSRARVTIDTSLVADSSRITAPFRNQDQENTNSPEIDDEDNAVGYDEDDDLDADQELNVSQQLSAKSQPLMVANDRQVQFENMSPFAGIYYLNGKYLNSLT